MKDNILNSHITKYIALALSIIAVFLLFNNEDIKFIENLMQLSIGAVVFWYIYKGRTDRKHIIDLIIITGIIMRIGYMLYTPIGVRGHDIDGHLAYIRFILNGHLPDSNLYQFYHPPFFHFMAAVSAKIIGALKYEGDTAIEAGKIISCFASCTMLIVARRITEELNMKKGAVIAVALTAFLSNYYLLAGRLNNDSLAIMFLYIAVLYTIRWYKKPCFRNVICIALAIGFGMMTKISVGTMAFFTGPVMLYVLFMNYKRDKKDLSIFKQLCAFAVICFPLALWYGVRNYILFDQPLNYVLRPSEDLPFYFENIGIYKRFIEVPIISGLKTVYHDPWTEYNLWIAILKGSLFGEFGFAVNEFIPRLFTIVNIFVVIMSTAGMIYMALSKKIKAIVKYVIIMLWLITFVTFFSFNISFPFGCTLDFRYIVPLALVSALSSGTAYDLLEENGNKLLKFMNIICILFVMCSFIMFTTIN